MSNVLPPGGSSQPTTKTAPKPATSASPAAVSLPGLTSQQSNALSGAERNAYQAIYTVLDQYGLGSLASVLYNYEIQGFDSQTVNFLIQQTPQWQQRFAGNVALEKQGIAPLDPATYLATEQAYQQALTAAGIPKGMYGQSDFAQWIGGSISPSEIQQRTQIAAQWVNSNDPDVLKALQQYHGITPNDMVGFALDQKRSLPYLNLVSQQAQVGAAALRSGLSSTPDFSWQLANMVQNGNLSQQAVDQGYSQIATELPRLGALASMTNKPFTQQTAEQATFLGNAAAQHQQKALVTEEQARFGGQSGLGSNFYHPGYGVARDLQGAY